MIQLLQRHGFVYDQLPAILWGLLIFIASSLPNVTLPDLEFVASDKAIHLIIYFILCALVYRALLFQERFPRLAERSLTCTVLLCVIYGLSDEIHQSFVPNRDASAYDLAADSIGALLFLGYSLLRQRLKLRQKRTESV